MSFGEISHRQLKYNSNMDLIEFTYKIIHRKYLIKNNIELSRTPNIFICCIH